jgi:hypothetical protein
MGTFRDPLTWAFAFLALSFVTLQVAVPFKVRGGFRVASLLPVTIIVVGAFAILRSSHWATNGWEGLPLFLFLVVSAVVADIVLVCIWFAFRFFKAEEGKHAPSA